jgi:hypothetical protein
MPFVKYHLYVTMRFHWQWKFAQARYYPKYLTYRDAGTSRFVERGEHKNISFVLFEVGDSLIDISDELSEEQNDYHYKTHLFTKKFRKELREKLDSVACGLHKMSGSKCGCYIPSESYILVNGLDKHDIVLNCFPTECTETHVDYSSFLIEDTSLICPNNCDKHGADLLELHYYDVLGRPSIILIIKNILKNSTRSDYNKYDTRIYYSECPYEIYINPEILLQYSKISLRYPINDTRINSDKRKLLINIWKMCLARISAELLNTLSRPEYIAPLVTL